MRKKNKIGNGSNDIVSMMMTQEDNDAPGFVKYSEAKGTSHDNQRFTLISFV